MKELEILDEFVFNQSFQLLGTLSSTTLPTWGRMTAQQMIEHLTIAVNVSNGINKIPLITPVDKVEKTKIILLLSDRAMPKFFHNPALPEDPIPCKHANISEAISSLKSALELFKIHFQYDPKKTQLHNIFGELNYTEWLWFHYKHFHHHFAQFELLTYTVNFEK
jgi:hydroxymethylglutaryl-CoA reductase